ncbi:MAG: DUF308 domain-containing protein [Desulfuromonas sp.]
MNQTNFSSPRRSGFRNLNNLFLSMGIVLTLLGVLAIAGAFFTTMATIIFFGVLLVLAGTIQLTHTLSQRSRNPFFRSSGVLYLLVGLIMLISPVGSAIGLTILLALMFVTAGAIRLRYAFAARKMGLPSSWYFTGAALNFVLTLLIISGLPETGTWVIGFFLGLELLFTGMTMIFLTARIHLNY